MNKALNKLAVASAMLVGLSGILPYGYETSNSYKEPKEKSDAGKFVVKYKSGRYYKYNSSTDKADTVLKNEANIFESFATAKQVANKYGGKVVKLTK